MGCSFRDAADVADLDQFNRELDGRVQVSQEFSKLSDGQKELLFEAVALMRVLYDVAGEDRLAHSYFVPSVCKNFDAAKYDILTGWLERTGFLVSDAFAIKLTQRGLDVVRATKS